MERVEPLIRAVRRERAPDPRTAIFDVRAEPCEGGLALVGCTTEPEAAADLAERVRALDGIGTVTDEITRLPDAMPDDALYGVVRTGIAPGYAEPTPLAAQSTQFVLGQRLDLLSHTGTWWQVRAEDGYIAWTQFGYLEVGQKDWAQAWERGEGGEPVVSLGGDLADDEGRPLVPLPWGARVVREAGNRFRLPDGRDGVLTRGEVIAADRLGDRFPLLGESVARTARRWVGTPYLWGGVTPAAVDCSGFVQAVLWMHGIALPRDSDLQAVCGSEVDAGEDFQDLRPGDLLFFFGEIGHAPAIHPDVGGGRVSHVALSLGGSQIIHAAMSSGGVVVNDLLGERLTERRLREHFVAARRLLPDPVRAGGSEPRE